MVAGNKDTCCKMFKKLNILPFHLLDIFSLLLFVVTNTDTLTSNSEVHTINTPHSLDLHPPPTNLTKL